MVPANSVSIKGSKRVNDLKLTKVTRFRGMVGPHGQIRRFSSIRSFSSLENRISKGSLRLKNSNSLGWVLSLRLIERIVLPIGLHFWRSRLRLARNSPGGVRIDLTSRLGCLPTSLKLCSLSLLFAFLSKLSWIQFPWT